MNEWMNEWMDGWMDGSNKQTNGWQINKWMNKWVDGWMNIKWIKETVKRINIINKQSNGWSIVFISELFWINVLFISNGWMN